MKTRLILVRHAEAEGNFKRIFQGWTDGELTEKGHKQAGLAAERLKDTPVDILYSSTLKRTLQTAEYISKIKNLPINRTDKLKEINGGEWEGKRWEELPAKWPLEYDTWEYKPHLHKMPGGENMVEFQQRIIKEIEYIARNNPGKNICIVTHGTAIRSLICYFEGCSLDQMQHTPWYDNTAITVVDYVNDKYELVVKGDASHLQNDMSTIGNQDWWKEYVKGVESRESGPETTVKIKKLLEEHRMCYLATCSKDIVDNAMVAFFAEDYCLYIGSFNNTLKGRNIEMNPRVAIAAGNLQLHGKASVLRYGSSEYLKAKKRYLSRFPEYQKYFELDKNELYVIKPLVIWLFDSAKGMMHRDKLVFDMLYYNEIEPYEADKVNFTKRNEEK